MKKIVFGALLVLTAALSGCVTAPIAPTDEQMRMANYGAPQTQQDAERIALALWQQDALDPASIMVRAYGPPVKWWVRDGRDQLKFGYLADLQVNGKNTYGGYTGWQRTRIFIRDRTLIWAWTFNQLRSGTVMMEGNEHRIT